MTRHPPRYFQVTVTDPDEERAADQAHAATEAAEAAAMAAGPSSCNQSNEDAGMLMTEKEVAEAAVRSVGIVEAVELEKEDDE